MFLGCGLDKREVKELLMRHGGKFDTRPFRGPLQVKGTDPEQYLFRYGAHGGGGGWSTARHDGYE